MELYNQIIGFLLGIVWHDALVVLMVGAGLYFTIRTRFVQFRLFPKMIKLLGKKDDKQEQTGISSFQAFLVSVGARVGTGNIAGVGVAICWGGPGAVFWMWVVGIVGAASAFVESTLAQIYKNKRGDEFYGGPAYYAEKGLGWKWFGPVLGVIITVSCLLGSPGVQANAIAATVNVAFGIPPVVIGAVVAIALGAVVFGGIKRIAAVSEKLVPIMCGLYLIVGVVVFVVNITKLPSVLGLIFSGAFGQDAMFGGAIGAVISAGVKRGVYSNEAGIGSATPTAAAADVKHPAEQGLIQACSVYVDTLVVCTITAFIILMTGFYNVVSPEDGITLIYTGIEGVDAGAGYVQYAIDSIVPIGKALVAIIMTIFAFTSLIGYYYQAEASFAFLIRKLSDGTQKIVVLLMRILIVLSTFIGSFFSATTVWNTCDVFGGLMSWFNIVLILLIGGPAFKALKDYDRQLKEGKEEPVFHAAELGIKNAELWDEEINVNK